MPTLHALLSLYHGLEQACMLPGRHQTRCAARHADAAVGDAQGRGLPGTAVQWAPGGQRHGRAHAWLHGAHGTHGPGHRAAPARRGRPRAAAAGGLAPPQQAQHAARPVCRWAAPHPPRSGSCSPCATEPTAMTDRAGAVCSGLHAHMRVTLWKPTPCGGSRSAAGRAAGRPHSSPARAGNVFLWDRLARAQPAAASTRFLEDFVAKPAVATPAVPALAAPPPTCRPSAQGPRKAGRRPQVASCWACCMPCMGLGCQAPARLTEVQSKPWCHHSRSCLCRLPLSACKQLPCTAV